MKNVALLVVDVQEASVLAHPYDEEKVLGNIKTLISFCRNQEIEVIYVRHDGGTGDELERNTQGWNIYEPIAPNQNERIFDKRFNSAFKDTELNGYLREKDVQTLVLVGIQTEYCVDTTLKTAFEYGYKIIIPEKTTTTYDNSLLSGKDLCEFYTYKIWNNRFAKVISMEGVLEMLQS